MKIDFFYKKEMKIKNNEGDHKDRNFLIIGVCKNIQNKWIIKKLNIKIDQGRD